MADLGNRTNVNSAIDLLLDDLAPDNSIMPSDHNGLLKDILDTLANGLSVTLRTGNTTSGQNLQVTSGDSIQFDNSTFLGSLSSATLTGNQSYSLPDKSGTIALTSEASILAVDSQTLGGNFTHNLNSNTLTLNNGVLNITNGGFGVLGSGNVTSDGIASTLFSFINSSSQPIMVVQDAGNVSIGTSVPDVSAKLEIDSTTQGFLKPRMTTAERDLIGAPATGLEIFNTTTGQTEFWDGASWSGVGGGDNFANADLTLTGNRTHDLSGNSVTFSGSLGTDWFNVSNTVNNGGFGVSNTEFTFICGGNDQHRMFIGNSVNDYLIWFQNGIGTSQHFAVGTASKIGSEVITLANRTAVQGADTLSSSTAFEIYDNDTTPSKLWDFRNNGDLYTNGNQGLSNTYNFGGGGSGDVATMTFTNGILTGVTLVP